MQAIYNTKGQTVGWLSYRDLYGLSGAYIGFVKGHGVYNIQSEFCGSLKKSVFRDWEGLVVAFMKGAKNSPVLPALKPSPLEPSKKSKPNLKPIGSVQSAKSNRLQWSKLDWNQYIS